MDKNKLDQLEKLLGDFMNYATDSYPQYSSAILLKGSSLRAYVQKVKETPPKVKEKPIEKQAKEQGPDTIEA